MKLIQSVALALLCAALLSGCLSIERKEYTYKLKPDGSGEGVIRYVNITSTEDDGKDVSFKDFAELVTDYIEGTKFEDDHPALRVTSKSLTEENGVLVAEIKFTFTSPDSAGFLMRPNCSCCPVMYFVKSDANSETITETNGKLIESVAASPFVEWEPGTRDFTLKTTIQEDQSSNKSMLEHYRNWKKK